MSPPAGSPRRRSAAERRELVIEAARREFAAFGLYGATGEAIAYRAQISHPYLLRLFGSKRELFLIVAERLFEDLAATVRDVVDPDAGTPGIPLVEQALTDALEKGDGFSLLLQVCAACGDDDVRPVVRRRFGELYEQVERASGAEPEDVRDMFASLTLTAAATALGLPDIAGRTAWARRILAAPERS